MGDFMRGLDVNHDGRITKEDWDRVQARAAKAENRAIAVRPGGHGDISQTGLAWTFNRGLPYVASPLYYEGRLYLVRDGGMVSCFDAKTGSPFYLQERLEAIGSYYASPVATDGRIYFASLNGKLSVIKAGGAKPEILHQADFGGRILATPALVGNNLYLWWLIAQTAKVASNSATRPSKKYFDCKDYSQIGNSSGQSWIWRKYKATAVNVRGGAWLIGVRALHFRTGCSVLLEASMQIAGNKCRVCGNKIILSAEGKFCARCEAVVHLSCDEGANCGVCGEPYRAHELQSLTRRVMPFFPRHCGHQTQALECYSRLRLWPF